MPNPELANMIVTCDCAACRWTGGVDRLIPSLVDGSDTESDLINRMIA